MMGMGNSRWTLYESEIVIYPKQQRATDKIPDKIQDFQNRFMLRFFEAPKQGTPTGIVELDANMLLMKNASMLNKLTYVGKLMAKSAPNNMSSRGCRQIKKFKNNFGHSKVYCVYIY